MSEKPLVFAGFMTLAGFVFILFAPYIGSWLARRQAKREKHIPQPQEKPIMCAPGEQWEVTCIVTGQERARKFFAVAQEWSDEIRLTQVLRKGKE